MMLIGSILVEVIKLCIWISIVRKSYLQEVVREDKLLFLIIYVIKIVENRNKSISKIRLYLKPLFRCYRKEADEMENLNTQT